MNSVTLSSLESAALVWLAESDFAQDPAPVRLPGGALGIEYWHTEYMCYGMLIVVDALNTVADILGLITTTERRIAARQQQDVDSAMANGVSRQEAHDAAYGYPTRTAICVPFDAIHDAAYEAYQRAAGTFDEPLVIAMWDGSTWDFQEEEVV